jgi:Cu-Zn family superoxide dismutase
VYTGTDNPQGSHAGDLPNVIIGPDGPDRLAIASARVSLTPGGPTALLGAEGSALVVHASPDDMKTDPTGDSGARIACGVIVPAPRAAGGLPVATRG